MIRWLLVSWAVNAVVLGVTGWILHGVTFHGSKWTVVWAALAFGILNTVLKPLLKLLTLPLALVSFGLAWFFVSMFMLWLTASIINGFDIRGFWNYVWATILVWACNVVIDSVFRDREYGPRRPSSRSPRRSGDSSRRRPKRGRRRDPDLGREAERRRVAERAARAGDRHREAAVLPQADSRSR